MDTQSIREKLMGRVQLIERRNDNNESVIHCFDIGDSFYLRLPLGGEADA